MGDITKNIQINTTPTHAKDYSNTPIKDKHIECPECHSNDTVCIYENAYGCIIGWTIIEEYFCNGCHKYIVCTEDYES